MWLASERPGKLRGVQLFGSNASHLELCAIKHRYRKYKAPVYHLDITGIRYKRSLRCVYRDMSYNKSKYMTHLNVFPVWNSSEDELARGAPISTYLMEGLFLLRYRLTE